MATIPTDQPITILIHHKPDDVADEIEQVIKTNLIDNYGVLEENITFQESTTLQAGHAELQE